MHICHRFDTLQDLEKRYGPRLRKRLERLLCLYRKHYRRVGNPMLVRAMCVAWAIVSEAEAGNLGPMRHLDDIVKGRVMEAIEMDGKTLARNEDYEAEVGMWWDCTCLTLEEYKVGEMPQEAYDIAGDHAHWAYRDEVMKEPAPSQAKPQEPAAPVLPAPPPQPPDMAHRAPSPDIQQILTQIRQQVLTMAEQLKIPNITINNTFNFSTMTGEEMANMMKLMNEMKPQVNHNYNAPIGQKIDHAETVNAHFDKDMQMQVGDNDAEVQSPQTDNAPRLTTLQLIILVVSLTDVTLDPTYTNQSDVASLIARMSGYKKESIRVKMQSKSLFEGPQARKDAELVASLLENIRPDIAQKIRNGLEY